MPLAERTQSGAFLLCHFLWEYFDKSHTEDVAGGAEGDPGESVFCERKGCHEGVHGSQGEAGGVDAVVEGRDEGEEDGHAVDDLMSSEESIGESEDDKGNGQRIEEHENRDGSLNDGGKAEESNGEGCDGEGRYPHGIGHSRNEFMEIFRAGSDEAYAGGEAGEKDDDPHDETAIRSEVVEGRTDENAGAVFLHAEDIDRACTQECKEYVNHCQAEAGDETGFQGRYGYFFICFCAVLADCINHDDTEDESRKGIHSAVAVDESLRQGFQCISIGVGGCFPGSHWEEGGHDEEKR